MTTRRNFILGLAALLVAIPFRQTFSFILSDPDTEMRDGWIMMKDDR